MQTIGLFTKTGCTNIASSKASSDTDSSSNPNSSAGDFVVRTTKSPAEELGLLDESVSDDALLDAMLVHPVLVNRPIVCTEKGVGLCRPSEKVLDLLPSWPSGPYFKEDGEQILDELGKRM